MAHLRHACLLEAACLLGVQPRFFADHHHTITIRLLVSLCRLLANRA